MGTRADFYVGRIGGKLKTVTWLGSIGYDGHHNNFYWLLKAKTKQEFVKMVNKMLLEREDATKPVDGWPWPWEDSCLTDVTYAWDDGAVWATNSFEDYVNRKDPKNGICPTCKENKVGWVLLAEYKSMMEKWNRAIKKHTKVCDAIDEKRLKLSQKLRQRKNPFETAKAVEEEFPYPEFPREPEWHTLIKKVAEFPNMKAVQNVTLGKRSGVIII